jgi:hypothetical protein
MRSDHDARLMQQSGGQQTALEMADEYFRLSIKVAQLEKKKFWFLPVRRSKKMDVEIRDINNEIGACWARLLRRFRPLVSACLRDGGMPMDASGGYGSSMSKLVRAFDKSMSRVHRAPCFAHLLWKSLADLAPNGIGKLLRYRVLFHLLALLDEFEDGNQGTIRLGYFFQDSLSHIESPGINEDLRYEQLTLAFENYHAFLCRMGERVDFLTGGFIKSSELQGEGGCDLMFSWLE